MRIHTLGGPVTAHLVAREKHRTVLRVSMGHVSFRCADLPMDRRATSGSQRTLPVGDRQFTATCLSVGNPHAVLLDAPFDEATAKKYGPLVENHAQFPRRTNVQFIRVGDRGTVEALIWERGAGWTLVVGTRAARWRRPACAPA